MPEPFDNLLTESGSINDLAYHGTSKTAADAILRDGFRVSRGEDQFLGEGVYFFDNQRTEAICRARDKKHFKPWAVLRATVRLGFCFNFQEEEHVAALNALISVLEREDPRVSDATAINALALLTQIGSVMCNIHPRETEPIRPKSRFRRGQRAILCIRTLANIEQCKVDCTGD